MLLCSLLFVLIQHGFHYYSDTADKQNRSMLIQQKESRTRGRSEIIPSDRGSNCLLAARVCTSLLQWRVLIADKLQNKAEGRREENVLRLCHDINS